MDLKTFNSIVLKESTLTRVEQWMRDNESGIISGNKRTQTYEENKAQNKEIHAQLVVLGYMTIRVRGQWIYHRDEPDRETVLETSFLVIDYKNYGTLKDDLKKIAKQHDQEAVIFLNKGGKDGVMIGTRGDKGDFPALDQEEGLHSRGLGVDGEFKTVIRGRPLTYQLDESLESFGNETKGQGFEIIKIGNTLNNKVGIKKHPYKA